MAGKGSDIVAGLARQLKAQDKRRTEWEATSARIDQQREAVERLRNALAVKQTAWQSAENRARAHAATGEDGLAEEARREADALAGEVQVKTGELEAAEGELSGLQRQALEMKRDIEALDASRREVHQTTSLSEVLACWNREKDRLEDGFLSVLEEHWPDLEAEAVRLGPVLRDRRRVDRSNWTKGRDGSADLHAIVRDAIGGALARYLEKHDVVRIEKVPR